MSSNLAKLPTVPLDEAFALTAAFLADTHPRKVSLGAGVYRDEQSKPWILPSVRKAKDLLHSTPGLNHEYLPIHGSSRYLALARELILGAGPDENVVSLQTISGTGANHLGALFLGQHLKPKNVFFSDPTWNNHSLIWTIAAPDVVQHTYPYYHAATRSLDFDGMLAKLEADAVENDVVVLHACAHNPTGIDPSREQWAILAELFKTKKLFAFFDSAYQGFATGDLDADAWAVRHFRQALFPQPEEQEAVCKKSGPVGACIAQSFSKNFGLYGERVGAFHLILPSGSSTAGAFSQLVRLSRAEISNPPLFGARVVEHVLSDPVLRATWKDDLRTMALRIRHVRARLRGEIEKVLGVGTWGHLESQIGMFSYTGLTKEQVLQLREEHHVYMMVNGRASLSGVNEHNVDYVAQAFCEVVKSSAA